jgi:hypothetical protein
MPFVILNEQGDPLTDLDGTLILLATRAEAEEWRRPWERVEVWEESHGTKRWRPIEHRSDHRCK